MNDHKLLSALNKSLTNLELLNCLYSATFSNFYNTEYKIIEPKSFNEEDLLEDVKQQFSFEAIYRLYKTAKNMKRHSFDYDFTELNSTILESFVSCKNCVIHDLENTDMWCLDFAIAIDCEILDFEKTSHFTEKFMYLIRSLILLSKFFNEKAFLRQVKQTKMIVVKTHFLLQNILVFNENVI